MNNYTTVTEALNDLFDRGYQIDFSIPKDEDCIYCHKSARRLSADEFVIDEVHRFEGDTDPGDEMIVYAISSIKGDLKGTLVNAYGIYADYNQSKIVEKLQRKVTPSTKPIKRANELVQLSREHHHGLLLCWKIKTGISKNIEPARIKKYVQWFYDNHLATHFQVEEAYVFPLLGESNQYRNEAIAQHRQLEELVLNDPCDYDNLMQFQHLLNAHIRFEERELFNMIQESGSLNKLEEIEALSSQQIFCDNESDPFWK
jgi:hemerythrin-like domain-containing protein